MFWFIQAYLLANQIDRQFFGMILAILLLTAAIFSWRAHWVERVVGRKMVFVLILTLSVLGYFLLGTYWGAWSWVFIFLFYATRGVVNPIIFNKVNRLTPSEIRATVLSVKNMIQRIFFAIIGPIMGYISDSYSLKIALFTSGIAFLFLGGIALFFVNKHCE
jgi:uncharacterized membrane protein (UPF0182 family)